ncbi:MAG: glycosyltransferase family 2 protein [Candidatus Levybacteria bacterium]|nr:glycosyltransferase family 2 protein [Candidatus Levybacteria bacterium]MDZ4228171.1 glycosyltransferase family 2 protein [Candidatus Levybacteria bacterium]
MTSGTKNILSVIILNYRTPDLTIKSLQSLISLYGRELQEEKIEIIVADNASGDVSIENIKKYLFNIKAKNIFLVENKENLGFAKGCNNAAGRARGKYLLFLNSDTHVEDRGFLLMSDFLEKNLKIGILGGKLYNTNGSIQPSAGKFYSLFNLVVMLLGFERIGFLRSSPNRIQKVDWVSGGCMMVRRDVFRQLRGFDEKLFMYMEDMEICFRAQKLNYETYFYPDVKIRHKSLGSSNKAFAIINIYQGILYFYLKHKPYWEYLIAKTLLTAKARILIMVGTLISNSDLKERYSKAIALNL